MRNYILRIIKKFDHIYKYNKNNVNRNKQEIFIESNIIR